MPFMDDLQASDGLPELPGSDVDSESQNGDTAPEEQNGMDLLASTAATRITALASRHSNSAPASPPGTPTAASDTVLGHRQRDSSTEEQSRRNKVRMAEFTRGICAELGVPATECGEIVEYSQVSRSFGPTSTNGSRLGWSYNS